MNNFSHILLSLNSFCSPVTINWDVESPPAQHMHAHIRIAHTQREREGCLKQMLRIIISSIWCFYGASLHDTGAPGSRLDGRFAFSCNSSSERRGAARPVSQVIHQDIVQSGQANCIYRAQKHKLRSLKGLVEVSCALRNRPHVRIAASEEKPEINLRSTIWSVVFYWS